MTGEPVDPRDLIASIFRWTTLAGVAAGLSLAVAGLVTPAAMVEIMKILGYDPSIHAELLRITPGFLLTLYGVLLTAVSLAVHGFTHGYIKHLRKEELSTRRVTLRLIVVTSFTIGFVGARVLVALSGIVGSGTTGSAGQIPVNELWILNYHVHHYFLGLLLLGAVGWIAVFRETYPRRVVAALYGLGMGVFMDEVGMLLTEGDYYAVSTYFVAVVFVSLFLAALYLDVRRARRHD